MVVTKYNYSGNSPLIPETLGAVNSIGTGQKLSIWRGVLVTDLEVVLYTSLCSWDSRHCPH